MSRSKAGAGRRWVMGLVITLLVGLGLSGLSAPEIDVQRPVGSSIADGGADDLGILTASPVSLTYTIDNTAGADPLTVDMPSASNFINTSGFLVTGPPTGLIESGNTGTFTIQFDIDADGALSFEMNIGNNDSGENPYDIVVSGMFDATPPSVDSIVRADSDPTNATSVDFTVTFDESVTSVDATDFVLDASGVTGTMIGAVTGGGTTWNVPVDTGAGDGTLSIDLNDDDTIEDLAGNRLGGAGLDNGDFGVGEAYTVDKTAPSIPDGLDPANGVYTNDTTPTLSWNASTDTGGSGMRTEDTYRYVVAGGSSGYTKNLVYTPTLAEGVYTWKIRSRDNAGNNSAYTAEYTLTIDLTDPGLTSFERQTPATSPTNADALIFLVTFDEDVQNLDTADFSINSTSTGTVTNVNQVTASTYDVTVSGGDLAGYSGTVNLNLAGGQNIQDLAGNTLPGGEPPSDELYMVDNTDPIDPTPSSSSHAVNVVSNDPTVDIEISGSSDPTSNGVASGVDGFDTAWDQNATWTTITEAKDQEETWAGGTFTAAPDGDWYFHIATVDNAGNWTSTQHLGPFPVDTDPPAVTDVTVSDTQITDADTPGTATFIVTVGFDEAMDTGVDPTLTFNPGVSTTLTLNPGQSGWTDADTYVAKYDVADGNVDHDSVTIDVTGAQDPAGNGQADYTPGPELEIDTLNPAVASVTATPTQIADATAGAGTFAVAIEFDESMNTGTPPMLMFAPDVTSGGTPTLSSPSGSWGGATNTYTVTYDVADQNVDVDSVTIDVTGGQDLAGNGQTDYTPVHEFDIDTLNPAITSITSMTPDGYYNVGANINVTVAFSEPVTLLGGTMDVTLDTPADVARFASFVSATEAMKTYTVGTDDNSCDLDAIGVVFNEVMTGAVLQDDAGNDANIFLPATTIADGSDIVVDTTGPTITWTVGFPDTTQYVDSDCSRTFPVEIRVTDNCCIDVGAVGFVVSNPAAATVVNTLVKTQIDGTRVDIVGSVTVSNLISCPATVTIDVAVQDCTGNTATSDDTVTVSDNTQPTYTWISGFPDTVQSMDEDCSLTFPIEVLVEDNCCLDVGNVTVTASDPADVTVTNTLVKSQEGASAVRISGDVTLLALTDGSATATIDVGSTDCCANGSSTSDSLTVVDDTQPTISGFAVTPDDGLVDANCEEVVTVYAVVSDNCCLDEANITVTPSITNGSFKDNNIVKTQGSDNQVTISGTIVVHSLTDCPAKIEVEVDATDCGGNNNAWTEDAEIEDEIVPVINDLMFNTDDSYTVWETDYYVDDCCLVPVYFSANVTDNCCMAAGNVDVTVTLPTGNALLESIVVNRVQNGRKRVDVTGTAAVRCLSSCPARVEVLITAADCCGNDAISLTSVETEGRVYDGIAPIARDDPRQDVAMDESAILDPLVEVRVDRNGTYRLLAREGSPVNLNVVANDSDNSSCVSHDPCAACSGCDAVLRIYDIVDAPNYGTAAILDAERMTRGDTTSIRYVPAPDFFGSDQFTYRIVDACGNVSSEATVYVEVVARSGMEDLFLTTCTDASVQFDVTATDPWMDPDDPDAVAFGFSILNPPAHGVVSGDLTGIVYTAQGATTADVASATIVLTYTPAAGYEGRDRMTVQCVDPFGASSEAVIDVTVQDCTEEEEPPPVTVDQGSVLRMILPPSFRSILESAWDSVLLVSLEDGLAYPGAVSATWDESAGQYVLLVATGGLAPGEYRLTLPLGNGETVELTIEVGEVE